MPFLKRMHRAILLPLVLRPRICVRRGWMRTRATTSVDGKNTVKFVRCFFFLAAGRDEEREKKKHFFTRMDWTY